MARKIKTFDMFGVTYRTKQFAAVRAFEFVEADDVSPLESLEHTEVLVGEDWLTLDSRERVNKYVLDRAGQLPAQLVLRALLKTVGQHSCGILDGWKGVKVPTRFTADGQGIPTRVSNHMSPVIAALISEDKATLFELETHYSLEDAMKMFDVMLAKSVSDALANEAAAKARKK
jgi:hypothetical protein